MNIDENNADIQSHDNLNEQGQENSQELTQNPKVVTKDNEDFQNPDTESYSAENEKPLTKNLLGDNPPGAEDAAFGAGIIGDASAQQFTYNSENIVEGFRESIDKTEEALALDKKLKDQKLD